MGFDTGIGLQHYQCDKKPHMQVTYKSATSSNIIDEALCKTHYNAFVKNCARINKKTGFDFKITSTPIQSNETHNSKNNPLHPTTGKG
jgi:hypothetical protein